MTKPPKKLGRGLSALMAEITPPAETTAPKKKTTKKTTATKKAPAKKSPAKKSAE